MSNLTVKIQKINNETVRPVRITTGDEKLEIKGANICPELYANIFLVAKKRSGKTSVVAKLINSFVSTDTVIITFCSTLYKDKIWMKIMENCNSKGIKFIGYTSLKEDNIDVLDMIINKLGVEAKEEYDRATDSDTEDGNNPAHVAFDSSDSDSDSDSEAGHACYRKVRTPKYLFIFDDLSAELKSKSLVSLLKKNRHYQCKVIISSQYPYDMLPESRKQIDLWLIFKGQPELKMKVLHKDSDSALEFDKFFKLYKYSTKDPYSFFYIDTNNNQYRINFDKVIKIQ